VETQMKIVDSPDVFDLLELKEKMAFWTYYTINKSWRKTLVWDEDSVVAPSPDIVLVS
jgi:hypothetical protein